MNEDNSDIHLTDDKQKNCPSCGHEMDLINERVNNTAQWSPPLNKIPKAIIQSIKQDYKENKPESFILPTDIKKQ